MYVFILIVIEPALSLGSGNLHIPAYNSLFCCILEDAKLSDWTKYQS